MAASRRAAVALLARRSSPVFAPLARADTRGGLYWLRGNDFLADGVSKVGLGKGPGPKFAFPSPAALPVGFVPSTPTERRCDEMATVFVLWRLLPDTTCDPPQTSSRSFSDDGPPRPPPPGSLGGPDYQKPDGTSEPKNSTGPTLTVGAISISTASERMGTAVFGQASNGTKKKVQQPAAVALDAKVTVDAFWAVPILRFVALSHQEGLMRVLDNSRTLQAPP